MTTAAPGWYPDPQNQGVQRYWDGERWTERVAAATPQANAVVYNNVRVKGVGGDSALHLLLTILTCGLWLPVWIVIEIIRAFSN